MNLLYHPTQIQPGFRATVHVGNVRQTAIIEAIQPPDKNISMNNDKANVVFRFIRTPEYIKPGARLLFREGRTKGMGRVTEIVPYEHVQNRWHKSSRVLKKPGNLKSGNSGSSKSGISGISKAGKVSLTLKKKRVTFACPGKSPRKFRKIPAASKSPKSEECEEEENVNKGMPIFVYFLLFCFLFYVIFVIDPELFRLVCGYPELVYPVPEISRNILPYVDFICKAVKSTVQNLHLAWKMKFFIKSIFHPTIYRFFLSINRFFSLSLFLSEY